MEATTKARLESQLNRYALARNKAVQLGHQLKIIELRLQTLSTWFASVDAPNDAAVIEGLRDRVSDMAGDLFIRFDDSIENEF